MYSEKIEYLIKAALADGVLTEKEKQILFKSAEAEGIDLDEFEMVLDARLCELKKEEQEKAQKSTPKSDKFGDVRKCPACGAFVSAGTASCKECGYAFTGINSASSLQQLYKELKEADQRDYKLKFGITSLMLGERGVLEKKAAAKATIIRNFPIPNAKSDLIELMSGIQTQANPKGRKDYMTSDLTSATEDLGLAYWFLYVKCINLAKTSFSKDPAFQIYFERYEELLWKSKNIFVRLFTKRK